MPAWMPPWWIWVAVLGALFLVFEVYGPALHGPFVLDDLYLPYGESRFPPTVMEWVRNQRPLLNFSYWLDYQAGWCGSA